VVIIAVSATHDNGDEGTLVEPRVMGSRRLRWVPREALGIQVWRGRGH